MDWIIKSFRVLLLFFIFCLPVWGVSSEIGFGTKAQEIKLSKILAAAFGFVQKTVSNLLSFAWFIKDSFSSVMNFWYCHKFKLPVWSYNHTERQVERQAACQAAKSHWKALWHFKMGPRSIPKRHGKRQNFKAAAWRLTLGVVIPLKANSHYASATMS